MEHSVTVHLRIMLHVDVVPRNLQDAIEADNTTRKRGRPPKGATVGDSLAGSERITDNGADDVGRVRGAADVG